MIMSQPICTPSLVIDISEIISKALEQETDYYGLLADMYKEFTSMSMRPFCNNANFERFLIRINEISKEAIETLDWAEICNIGTEGGRGLSKKPKASTVKESESPDKPDIEFLKQGRQNNSMDFLQKFVDKHNSKEITRSFFMMYGKTLNDIPVSPLE